MNVPGSGRRLRALTCPAKPPPAIVRLDVADSNALRRARIAPRVWDVKKNDVVAVWHEGGALTGESGKAEAEDGWGL